MYLYAISDKPLVNRNRSSFQKKISRASPYSQMCIKINTPTLLLDLCIVHFKVKSSVHGALNTKKHFI